MRLLGFWLYTGQSNWLAGHPTNLTSLTSFPARLYWSVQPASWPISLTSRHQLSVTSLTSLSSLVNHLNQPNNCTVQMRLMIMSLVWWQGIKDFTKHPLGWKFSFILNVMAISLTPESPAWYSEKASISLPAFPSQPLTNFLCSSNDSSDSRLVSDQIK